MTADTPTDSRDVPTDGRGATAAAVAFVLRSARARPQTTTELRAKLDDRGYDGSIVDAAITRCTELGAIDDAAFARAWVADRGLVRGYSASRLRGELRRRQVPDPVIDEALTPVEERDDLAVATELARQRAQRMPATLEPPVVARRLLGFLARRGYNEALARRVAIAVSGVDRQWD